MVDVVCSTPANAGQLTSGDPRGGSSCVAYSYAYSACDVTDGLVHPTGRQIRLWTGDTTGGLELGQCDTAMHVHTTLEYETGVYNRQTFLNRIHSGKEGAVILGGYRAVEATRFSGQPGFVQDHGMWLPPSFKAMDPLADGRHPSTYRYHGEVYPESLILDFMAALMLYDRNGYYAGLAGSNHVEASWVRLVVADSPAPTYHLSMGSGAFGLYKIVNGQAVTVGVHPTGGFSGTCTPPHRWPWHGSTLKLVQMTSGVYSTGKYKGLYVNAGAGRATLTSSQSAA